MADIDYIEHEGIVSEVTPNLIRVSIISKAACVSCQVKGVCSASDIEEKIVDVYQSVSDIKVGQRVTLVGKNSLAPKAVILAYVIPVVLILATLITVFHTTGNEILAGVLSLAVLVPYFIIIYLLKDKLKKTFSFTIKHQIN